jgi:hypothetical protein
MHNSSSRWVQSSVLRLSASRRWPSHSAQPMSAGSANAPTTSHASRARAITQICSAVGRASHARAAGHAMIESNTAGRSAIYFPPSPTRVPARRARLPRKQTNGLSGVRGHGCEAADESHRVRPDPGRGAVPPGWAPRFASTRGWAPGPGAVFAQLWSRQEGVGKVCTLVARSPAFRSSASALPCVACALLDSYGVDSVPVPWFLRHEPPDHLQHLYPF